MAKPAPSRRRTRSSVVQARVWLAAPHRRSRRPARDLAGASARPVRAPGAQLLAQSDAIGGGLLGPNSGSAGFSRAPDFLSRFRLILLDGRAAL